MLQYDQQKINLETTLGTMSPIFKDSNKANINFKDLLSHYAGLAAGIPFYKATMDNSKFPSEVFLEKYLKKFSKRLRTVSFIRNDFSNTIMDLIVKSKISTKRIQIQRFDLYDFKGLFRKQRTLDNSSTRKFLSLARNE
jgi:hypothetical protein